MGNESHDTFLEFIHRTELFYLGKLVRKIEILSLLFLGCQAPGMR